MPSLIFYPQIILPIQIESCYVDMQPFIAKNVCSILTYDKNHIETEDVQPIIKVQKMILHRIALDIISDIPCGQKFEYWRPLFLKILSTVPSISVPSISYCV